MLTLQEKFLYLLLLIGINFVLRKLIKMNSNETQFTKYIN